MPATVIESGWSTRKDGLASDLRMWLVGGQVNICMLLVWTRHRDKTVSGALIVWRRAENSNGLMPSYPGEVFVTPLGFGFTGTALDNIIWTNLLTNLPNLSLIRSFRLLRKVTRISWCRRANSLVVPYRMELTGMKPGACLSLGCGSVPSYIL